MSVQLWLAFVAATAVLLIIPGPTILTVISYSMAHGKRANIPLVAAVALGDSTALVVSLFGLGALLAASAFWFTVVKWAGGLYLLYLGIKALRAPLAPTIDAPREAPPSPRAILRDGFFVALLNPKTALFFAAFLPQFIDPALPALAQSVLFGAAFVAIAACTDTAYVLAAGLATPALGRLKRARASGRYLTAAIYIGLGLFTAASGSRGAK